MLSVTVRREKKGITVESRTLEAAEVRYLSENFRYADGQQDESAPCVQVEKYDGTTIIFSRHPLHEDERFLFFVMNENGQTVARHGL